MMCTAASNKIESVKNFIEFQLNYFGIGYETFYEEDVTLGGYCYFICSDYAAVLFSDHTPDKNLKMYKLNDKLLEWCVSEGLTDEQRMKINLYDPIYNVSDMIDVLTNYKFSKI